MKLMIASDIHGSAYYCRKMLDAYKREGADRLLALATLHIGTVFQQAVELVAQRGDRLVVVAGEEVAVEHDVVRHAVGNQLDLGQPQVALSIFMQAGFVHQTGFFHAAQTLVDAVKPGDLVYILTGFVLLPHKVPEMDGMVSSMLLARALVMAFGAKPVIVCPADSVQAIEKCAAVVGLHIYEDLDIVQTLPLSMGVAAFTKSLADAPAQAAELDDFHEIAQLSQFHDALLVMRH